MTTVAVIPCCAPKLDHAATAATLYTSSTFRMALAAAHEVDDDVTVYVLSARHGLVALDTILDPYETTFGDDDAVDVETVAAQAWSLGLHEHDVYALLPKRYLAVLDGALRLLGSYVSDVYEATIGVGDHRHVCAVVATSGDSGERAA